MVFHHFNLHFPDEIYDAEHVFMQLFEICISSLARCLFRSLGHILSSFFGHDGTYGSLFPDQGLNLVPQQ